MDSLNLEVNRTYRAKKPAPAGSLFNPLFNDRTIVWIGGDKVQYDGPSVAIGRKRPIVSRTAFLKWASHDVTDSLPADEYEPFKKQAAKKKVVVEAEQETDEWLANDISRRGWHASNYWDIRHKSMTPPEVIAALAAAANLSDEDKKDCDILPSHLFDDYSFVGFFTQDNTLALKVIDSGCDFLFDKASGIWFIDMFGRHQIVMSALEKMYTKKDQTIVGFKEDADAYIEDCRGFFNSGAATYGQPTVRMSENYVLPAELKTAFSRIGFAIWRM